MKDFPLIIPMLSYTDDVDNLTFTLTRNSLNNSTPIGFAFNASRPPMTGVEVLVQMVAKGILTTPGYNIFSPKLGAGISSLVGKAHHPAAISSLMTDVIVYLNRLEKNIKDAQLDMPNLEDVEKLDRISLRKCSLNSVRELEIEIDIYNMAGEMYPLEVTL